MKQLIPFLVALFTLQTSTAQTPAELVQEYGKAFPKQTELAIAVIEGDKVSYYGFIKKDSSFEAKKNASAIFEIGSITKVFTSTLLAHQVVNKKMKLDQLVKKHLPFKLKGNPKITLKSLSNHTSGLPRLPDNLFPMMVNNPDNPYKGYDVAKLKEYCTKQLSLQSAVGERSDYSNLGAGLLGYAIAQKTKKSYETLLQEFIFIPLEMHQSTTNRSLVEGKLVRGLSPDGQITSNWDLEALAPAGNILSSVDDLSKFILANFDTKNPVYQLQQSKTMSLHTNMDVALAWHIITTKTGKKLHWHNGGTGGYTASMAMDVDHKKGLVLLSNVSAFHPKTGNIDALVFKWMETLEKPTEE
ncbi:MAG: Beta-lactamase (EC [uncultured Aureispira sp.]|uniref:Beta-lactamase (EC) n=1 Tax=uncultured Aureispira sp. TaxID=1331704 RepID=A0A6S6SCA4_9BACT|nr:MAG: Beta-lactamase (EC [uncultured Aureispira sp.]